MIELLQKLNDFINHLKSHREIKYYRFIKIIRDEIKIDNEFDSIKKDYTIYELVDAVANIVMSLTNGSKIKYINDDFRLEDQYVYMELDSGIVIYYYSNIKHNKFVIRDECYTYEVSSNLPMTKAIENKWNETKEELIELLHSVLIDMVYLV